MNKELKEQIEMLVKDDEEMQKTIIDLSRRIDKAIEYIKNKARNNCWIDQYESCELIKILRGEE